MLLTLVLGLEAFLQTRHRTELVIRSSSSEITLRADRESRLFTVELDINKPCVGV